VTDVLAGPDVMPGPVVTVIVNWRAVDVPTLLVAVTVNVEVPASPVVVARVALMTPVPAVNVAHAGSAPLEIANVPPEVAGFGNPLVVIVKPGKV
jgi:hypothetical protein